MKKPRFPHRTKSPRIVQELYRLAAGLAASGSRIEDAFWENRLAEKIHVQLRSGDDQNLEAVLDQLYETDQVAYSEFVHAIEAAIECNVFVHEGCTYDVLMFAISALTWSRFSIPSGPVPATVLTDIRQHLQQQVLAADVRFTVADCLFSPDQLPRGYHLTHELASKLWAAALAGKPDLHINTRQLPETSRFLADTRYLLGAIVVPQGMPMFRWQGSIKVGETGAADRLTAPANTSRKDILSAWQSHASESLRPVFHGCDLQLLLPDGFFSAWRATDRQSRPYSMHATVTFLQSTLNVASHDLRAIVAPFHDQWLEEYRISFTFKDREDVLYGIVWSLVGEEDENSDIVTQIEATLRACGISDIIQLDSHFPLEYCDDCGGPLFPNAEGEVVHAEFPEASDTAPAHLH